MDKPARLAKLSMALTVLLCLDAVDDFLSLHDISGDYVSASTLHGLGIQTWGDLVVTMDGLSAEGNSAVYRWTLTGTNVGPGGGTGRAVRISGYEQWTIGTDGLIAESRGHFDESESSCQLHSD